VVGLLTLGEHSPRDLRVAIDCVWLTPAFQGSGSSGGDHAGALVETVLLVLTHLFDAGYRRVEWRCDGHNVRARRAGHSLGFVFEGVLRKHRIVKDCNCDTVVFAAINSEWPVIRGHLEARLESLTSRAVTADEEDKKTR
jgi:RimJ/RimL family protein N-acetyltransferase